MDVSIPQAVGTIAIPFKEERCYLSSSLEGFNTASGRYYCNENIMPEEWCELLKRVSIPQAVGTIAIIEQSMLSAMKFLLKVSIPQAVGTIAIADLTKPVFMGIKNRFWKTSHRKRSKRTPI